MPKIAKREQLAMDETDHNGRYTCVIVQAVVAVTHREMWKSTNKGSEGQGKDDWKQADTTVKTAWLWPYIYKKN